MDKNSKSKCECWNGYKRVPGTKPCAPGSCEKCDGHSKEANIEIGRSTIPDSHIMSSFTPTELDAHLAAGFEEEPMAEQGMEPAGPLGLEQGLGDLPFDEVKHSLDLGPEERSTLQALLEQIVGGGAINPENRVVQEWIPMLQEIIQKLRNPNRTAAVSQDAAQHLLEEQTPDLDPYAQFGLYKAAAGEEVPFEGVSEPNYVARPGDQPVGPETIVEASGDGSWFVQIPYGQGHVVHADVIPHGEEDVNFDTGTMQVDNITGITIQGTVDILDENDRVLESFNEDTIPADLYTALIRAVDTDEVLQGLSGAVYSENEDDAARGR